MSLSPKQHQSSSTTTPFSVTDILSPLEDHYAGSEVNRGNTNGEVNSNHNHCINISNSNILYNNQQLLSLEQQGHSSLSVRHYESCPTSATGPVHLSAMDPGSLVAVSAALNVPSIGDQSVMGSMSPTGGSVSSIPLYRHPMSIGTSQHGVHHQQMQATMPYQSMNSSAAMGMNGGYNLHTIPPSQSSFHSMSGAGSGSTGYCNGGMADLASYNNVQSSPGWYSTPTNPDPRFGTMPSKFFLQIYISEHYT